MATVFTFHRITSTLLTLCVVFVVIGLIGDTWFSHSLWRSYHNSNWIHAVRAFVLIGVIGVCLALVLEILREVSATFRNRAIHLLIMLGIAVGFVSLLLAAAIGGAETKNNCFGYSYTLMVCGLVFLGEAVFFHIVGWMEAH